MITDVGIRDKNDNVIDPPDVLHGGFKVISYHHRGNHGGGVRTNGLVVALTGPRFDPTQYDPFATWNVYYDDERNEWYAESGNYCRTIEKAVESFQERKESW